MAAADQNLLSLSGRIGRNQDVLLGLGVISILAVLVLPVPTPILDLLLTVNISISVIILLITIYLQHPVDFAVFPSLLLMLTLFRLSLNVAATRAILKDAYAGRVIEAFGGFVTSGNIVVGVVIFAILVIIQFVVITKGATRISEVAARFTLDAMPGKQMGVDADLNAGLITEAQAKERRRRIEREADFYGAMDGSTKFVRGDAIAGLIITIVNIIAGFIIGVTMNGMEFATALETYTRLTIGDGLVSQIPALIVSTSAGLIVTRTTSDNNLGADFGAQLMRYPRALGISAFMLTILGIVPGMPTMAFFTMAIIVGSIGWLSHKAQLQHIVAVEAEEIQAARRVEEETPQRTEDLLFIDPLKIELGYGLIALADPKQGGDLLTRIQIIRQQMASRMGFVVPVVRIVDNMRLRANEYRIKLREAQVATYELLPGHYLAMNPGLAEQEIDGIATREPAFNLPAKWVPGARRDEAERLGYTLVEPSAVLATHLTEVITQFSSELLSRQDVKSLVDNIKPSAGTVVDELIPGILALGDVQKVLQALLGERVSIRNLETILETLADYGPRTRDTELLTEYVRHALARQICGEYADEDGVLHVVTLSPNIERELLGSVRQMETGEYLPPMDPTRVDTIAVATVDAVQPLVLSGQEAIVLTSAQVRRFFRRMVERRLPRIVVLSYNEIDSTVQLEGIGQVSV